MSLTVPEQIRQLVDQHTHFLLVFPPHDRGDALSSALALRQFLISKNKQVEVVSSGYVTPKNFHFLPGAHSTKMGLENIHKFIIKVDISHAPVETLSYDVKDNWLSIYITPKTGSITKQELRTAQTNFKYDCVFTFGASDLEALGDIFFNNTDLFYRTPVVNIDHTPHNERFGQINWVELTAAATTEATYRLLKQMGAEIDTHMATTLLAGMTAATKSFTTSNVTPATLTTASELVEKGAERDTIVQHLYRTRSVGGLKLWGAALSHLVFERGEDLVLTTLTRDDFTRTGTDATALHGLVDELIMNTPEAHRFVLLYEDLLAEAGVFRGILATNKNFNALQLVAKFNPEGKEREAHFTVKAPTIQEAIEKVRTALAVHKVKGP